MSHPQNTPNRAQMTSARLDDSLKKVVTHPRRRRSKPRTRFVESIAYVVLGIVLYAAWHRFRSFEGLPGALGPIPHDHPMHRGIEIAVFLAIAVVPLAVYLILGFRRRRSPRRTQR